MADTTTKIYDPQQHTHNGVDSLKINYSNIVGAPSAIPTALTYSPSAGGTVTLNLDGSNQHFIQMPAGNITIALKGGGPNQVFYITITQDSGGSRTVTWFTTIRWPSNNPPTLSTGANKRDCFIFSTTGQATYDGFITGQNL